MKTGIINAGAAWAYGIECVADVRWLHDDDVLRMKARLRLMPIAHVLQFGQCFDALALTGNAKAQRVAQIWKDWNGKNPPIEIINELDGMTEILEQ